MTSPNSPHLVFTGGGTAGHLFPGLAVANQLAQLEPNLQITFATSGKPFEKKHVEAAGFDYLPVPCRALPRRLSGVIPFLTNNLTGYRAAGRFLDTHPVSLVVGTGGYASVPTARAAIRRHIPLVLLEQNAVPGRATRWLTPSATAICTAFPETSQHLPPRSPVRVTGNPVRPGFISVAPNTNPKRKRGTETSASPTHPASATSPVDDGPAHPRSLLVLGGSHGARSLNLHVPPALKKLAPQLSNWNIIHQSGPAELSATQSLYQQLGVEATVLPFIPHLPQLLARCDLAVSRAGGTTLAELACSALPAILLPYPHAADDHQRKNSQAYSTATGCILLDERDPTAPLVDQLAAAISQLVTQEHRRNRISTALHRLAKPNAAHHIATLLHHLLHRASHRAAA